METGKKFIWWYVVVWVMALTGGMVLLNLVDTQQLNIMRFTYGILFSLGDKLGSNLFTYVIDNLFSSNWWIVLLCIITALLIVFLYLTLLIYIFSGIKEALHEREYNISFIILSVVSFSFSGLFAGFEMIGIGFNHLPKTWPVESSYTFYGGLLMLFSFLLCYFNPLRNNTAKEKKLSFGYFFLLYPLLALLGVFGYYFAMLTVYMTLVVLVIAVFRGITATGGGFFGSSIEGNKQITKTSACRWLDDSYCKHPSSASAPCECPYHSTCTYLQCDLKHS